MVRRLPVRRRKLKLEFSLLTVNLGSPVRPRRLDELDLRLPPT